jgi:hypothetical protein
MNQPDTNIVVSNRSNYCAFFYRFNSRRINHVLKLWTPMYRWSCCVHLGTNVVSFTHTVASENHSPYRHIQRDTQRLHHRKDST